MLQTNGDRAPSSDTLRAFVKMHEDKLNAKISHMRANRLRSRSHDTPRHGGDEVKLID